jgi:hypothetical protein
MTNMNWRTKAYATGAVVGAALGLGAAYLYVNAAEKRGEQPDLPPSEAVAIGLALLAVLRQLATVYEKDSKQRKPIP